jgi:hypothetical protein
MSVPGYQSLMAPVLSALADGGDHSLAELRAILAERLGLTEEDRQLCCIMSVMSPCAKTPGGSVPGHQPRSWPPSVTLP